MFNKIKAWLKINIRLNENSTKWGLGILGALLFVFVSQNEIGHYTDKILAITTLLSAIKLIDVRDAPAK